MRETEYKGKLLTLLITRRNVAWKPWLSVGRYHTYAHIYSIYRGTVLLSFMQQFAMSSLFE